MTTWRSVNPTMLCDPSRSLLLRDARNQCYRRGHRRIEVGEPAQFKKEDGPSVPTIAAQRRQTDSLAKERNGHEQVVSQHRRWPYPGRRGANPIDGLGRFGCRPMHACWPGLV